MARMDHGKLVSNGDRRPVWEDHSPGSGCRWWWLGREGPCHHRMARSHAVNTVNFVMQILQRKTVHLFAMNGKPSRGHWSFRPAVRSCTDERHPG